MSEVARATLLTVFGLASCTWVGGYVAIAVVARVASRTLAPAQRVAFFRALGRSYLRVGVPALLLALGTGTVLLAGHPWDAGRTTAVVVAAALVASLVLGVVQARRMTRLRVMALRIPESPDLRARLRRGARSAAVLRSVVGLLSLVLVTLGAVLAS